MRRGRQFPMAADTRKTSRFFLSYTGVKPPLNLVGPIAAEALSNRNTFIRAYFNEAGAPPASTRSSMARWSSPVAINSTTMARLSLAEIAMLDEDAVSLQFDAAEAPI